MPTFHPDFWEGSFETEEKTEMPDQATQQAIELKLATGEVIKAPSLEEALKIAVKMTEDTKVVYQQEKQAREQLEQRTANLEAQIARNAAPKAPENGFDQTKYFQLLNENAALAADYVDAYRFGINDPSRVRSTFIQMQNDISTTRQEALGAQFAAQHENFPSNVPEARRELVLRFSRFVDSGYPQTLETLNMAYDQAVSEGAIKPLEIKEPEPELERNPTLVGGGMQGITDEEANKIEQMPDKELEALLRQKGLLA